MLAWASSALNSTLTGRTSAESSSSSAPAGSKKRAASDDEPTCARPAPAGASSGGAAAPAKRAKAARKPVAVLRTVEDLEAWLNEVCTEVDAELLQQSTRNIMHLLTDSRTAARPARFPHKGGNPLRSAMAFEEVLLQEGTNHVGKLLFNLYKNEHCNDLAKELLAVCVGASDAQLQLIHEQLTSIAQVEHLDGPLTESLCRSIQTLQQRARLGRMQMETQELKISIEQSRETLREKAAAHADEPQATAEDVDGLLELLEVEKAKLLPLHEQISTSFLFDGTQFDELAATVEAMKGAMAEQQQELDAQFSARKEEVKALRKKRRSLLSSQEDEEEDGAEHHASYLSRMRAEEEARKTAVESIEGEIKAAIEGMEGVGAELHGVEAKVSAAEQLSGFISTAGEVFSRCTAEQRQEADDARKDLLKAYADDILMLCGKLDQHLTLQCKRINLFKARLAPKEAELKKLQRLCLGEKEAASNRQSLEKEVAESRELITQSLSRVSLCASKVTELVEEYVRLERPEEEVSIEPLTPEAIAGGHYGSFMGQDATDGNAVRVTVDPHGLSMYKQEALIAFYEYKAIKSWDMSEKHFGLTPSKIAQETRQNTRKTRVETLEGREIAKMMSANAHLLVGQRHAEEEATRRVLLVQRQRIADYAALLVGYADGSVVYSGNLSEDGIPEGDGKIKLSDGCQYEGEFKNGQPNGRGKYTYVGKNFPGGIGRVYDGEFIGLRPVGGGHIYRVTSKPPHGIADVYEGQLHNFSFHGTGRLRSGSAVEGMICHYEGAFEKDIPQSRYARLWMMTMGAAGAYRRLSADRVAMYLGPINDGVPSATGAQLVLPPGSTTYQGTFDNVAFLNYGKPSGFGTIRYANGNVYQGPIQEGPGGSFMPVLMAGELLVRSTPGVPLESQFDCIYKGEFDNQGRPDGEGKLVRESDGRVVHEGQFKEGQPSVGWVKWMFG